MIVGIGTDIVEIDRIAKAIDKWGDHFIQHIYTPEEIEYVKQHKFPSQHYAVRFAAKEAVYKAMEDQSRLGWKDVQILNDASGKPFCTLLNQDFKHKIHLSLSHSKSYAVANVVITTT